MPQAAMIGAFLAGLLGGLHCAAMCGAWVAVAGSATSGVSPLLPARRLAFLSAAAHAGRISTYVAIGAALGAAGGPAFALSWAPVQQLLYAAANVMLLLLAVSLASERRPLTILERGGLHLFRRIAPAFGNLVERQAIAPRLLMGMLWGLTPCALVYSVLPLALLAGGALQGALVMLAFGIATLPNLVVAGYALSRLSRTIGGHRARIAAGCVVGAFAFAGLYRVIFHSDAFGGSPFCLVP